MAENHLVPLLCIQDFQIDTKWEIQKYNGKTGWKKPEKKTTTPNCHDTPRSLGSGRMNRDACNRRREI
jgi:hypothetical protein